MPSETGYPIVMVHLQHKPAVLTNASAVPGSTDYDLPGSPERFPPIEVHSANQEAQTRARGYLRYGENMPEAAKYSEFPKMLHHPGHVDAIPVTMGARMENAALVQFQIPGVPEKYPPVQADDEGAEERWNAKGYFADATPDPVAFDRAHAAPGKPGSEWPKWVDGVLTQDPDMPPDLTGQYPKWLNFEGGDSVLVVDLAHEQRVIAARHGARAEAEKQPARPYVAPTPAPARDAEYEEFMAWKAARESRASSHVPAMLPAKNTDRETLIALAEETGIEIDKRWGLARLREAVLGETAPAD